MVLDRGARENSDFYFRKSKLMALRKSKLMALFHFRVLFVMTLSWVCSAKPVFCAS